MQQAGEEPQRVLSMNINTWIIFVGMNIVFTYFDFHIGPLHVVYANMPGLFMSFCFIIVTCLAYFTVADISRDFDPKGEMERQLVYGTNSITWNLVGG